MARGTYPSLETYLRTQYSWDDDYKNLWKTVSWSFTTKEGKPGTANYAAQSFDDLLSLIESKIILPNTDVWVSTGTQRIANLDVKSKGGHAKAIRKINNTATHNSVYVDIDVKPDAYATTDEARDALDDFADKLGLPMTTMEVLSGSGGIHAYWTMDKPMQLDEWQVLSKGLRDAAVAYGLKFDPQVSVNAAGILRPPETFNWKTMPPKIVQLDPQSSFQTYKYADIYSCLHAYIDPVAAMRQPMPGTKNVFTENFTANVGAPPPPVPIEEVAAVCPTIHDILTTGGKGNSEPLWNQAMLLATFTVNPYDAAHRLSSGDPRYTVADTDKKLTEKVQARLDNPKLGWPQCATFNGLHPACKACALLVHGKSPLSFAKRPMAPPQSKAPPQQDPLMPLGYWRDPKNLHIMTAVTDDKGGGHSTTIDVLGWPIVDAGVDKVNNELVFRTNLYGVDTWHSVKFSSALQPTAASQQLAAQALYVNPYNFKTARDFLVSWMTHLQNTRKLIAPATYGWTPDGKGFTFDHTVYTANGKDLVFRGSTHDTRFVAAGDLQPWKDAMELVYGNPSLEAVVASAFAAPLVQLTAPASVVMSVFSSKSGIGKTTAMMLAQGVWGHPREGMSSLADTINSVMKKVGDLKNLPVYWDELHTQGQMEKCVDLVFQITQGKAKSRLTRDIQQAAAPSFTTMFVVASNSGITDDVFAHTDGTEAGGLRVFELEAEPTIRSKFKDHEARQLLKDTEENYGQAGAIYAEFLAKNRPVAKDMLLKISQQLNSTNPKERFWVITITTIMAGAFLANAAGLTRFDTNALWQFLLRTMADLRHGLKDQGFKTLSTANSGEEVLSTLISALRTRNLVITKNIFFGPGRQPPVDASETGDISRLSDVWMQIGTQDGRIRVRCALFHKWLRENNLYKKQVMKLLEQSYTITKTKSAIGIGVPFLSATQNHRSECYDMDPLVLPTTSGSTRDFS